MSSPATPKPAISPIVVAGQVIPLADLGSPLNEDFFEFYSAHLTNGVFAVADLLNHSFDYFDINYQSPQLIDSYFENYAPLWNNFMNLGKFGEALKVFTVFGLTFAWGWEKRSGKSLNKGTPYYFAAVSKIATDALDEGFYLMHQALEEDKRTFAALQPSTPAYHFVTLDSTNPKQFFYGRVKQVSGYLNERILVYQKSRSGKLTLQEFQRRFLKEVKLEDQVFFFVALLHKLHSFSVIENELKHNSFASLNAASLLFSLDLIIDSVICLKDSADKFFPGFLIFLAKSSKPPLTITSNDLGQLNADFQGDFGKTLLQVIASKYILGSGHTLSPIEEDFAVAYGFRNLGAHKIEFQKEIIDNFEEILQRLYNVLFFAVEQIY